MAIVKPLRGILYNLSRFKNLSDILTPPYDVISPKEQEKYYKLHPYNFIRLDLPKDYPNDNPKDNIYTRAARTFYEWLETNILTQDNDPCFYLLEQEYMAGKEKHKRKGLILLVKLEELSDGSILPHERTFLGPKTDRLNMLRACNANFSQVFGLYSDPENQINNCLEEKTQFAPVVKAITNKNITNRLWKISDEKTISKITEAMKNKCIFIADGHHRYTTALIYRNEMRKLSKKPPKESPFDYVSMFLVNMDNEDMTILPVHRLVKNISRFDIASFQKDLMQYFDIEILSFAELLKEMKKRESEHAFGLYSGEKTPYLLTLKNKEIINDLLGEKHTKEWKELDVSILHTLIIEKILGISKEKIETEDCIKFTINKNEAVELVDKGDYQVAFFVNPTKIEQLKSIASNREVMPQKSTYFYPKIPSGLVINKLEW